MTINTNVDIHKDCVSLKEHLTMLVQETNKRTTDVTFERDRRYSEVNIEKEKALKIKEEADKVALGLAREIQTYKDETHNGLLKKWQDERGSYVTSEKFDATIKPLSDYVSLQQGKSSGLSQGWLILIGGIGLVSTLLNIYLIITRVP